MCCRERNGKPQEREFPTFPRDLRSLRGWLKRQQVTEVVMESTGQYWRPLWNVLEREVPRLLLVNPAHVKALAGRKTDRIDSQLLAIWKAQIWTEALSRAVRCANFAT